MHYGETESGLGMQREEALSHWKWFAIFFLCDYRITLLLWYKAQAEQWSWQNVLWQQHMCLPFIYCPLSLKEVKPQPEEDLSEREIQYLESLPQETPLSLMTKTLEFFKLQMHPCTYLWTQGCERLHTSNSQKGDSPVHIFFSSVILIHFSML